MEYHVSLIVSYFYVWQEFNFFIRYHGSILPVYFRYAYLFFSLFLLPFLPHFFPLPLFPSLLSSEGKQRFKCQAFFHLHLICEYHVPEQSSPRPFIQSVTCNEHHRSLANRNDCIYVKRIYSVDLPVDCFLKPLNIQLRRRLD